LQNLALGPDRPVDLRMNPSAGVPASEWIAGASVEELAWVLYTYGADCEDPVLAERTAQAIIDEQTRRGRPFTSMRDFADVVMRSRAKIDGFEDTHTMYGKDHPARLTLQALRLYVNQELEELRSAMEGAFELLVPGGRCVACTFKRKEMDVVRKFVIEHEEPDEETVSRIKEPRRLRELYPLLGTDLEYSVQLLGRPLQPASAEVSNNKRARSGYMYAMGKAPRTMKKVRRKPRLEKNRLKEPSAPILSCSAVGEQEGASADGESAGTGAKGGRKKKKARAGETEAR